MTCFQNGTDPSVVTFYSKLELHLAEVLLSFPLTWIVDESTNGHRGNSGSPGTVRGGRKNGVLPREEGQRCSLVVVQFPGMSEAQVSKRRKGIKVKLV